MTLTGRSVACPPTVQAESTEVKPPRKCRRSHLGAGNVHKSQLKPSDPCESSHRVVLCAFLAALETLGDIVQFEQLGHRAIAPLSSGFLEGYFPVFGDDRDLTRPQRDYTENPREYKIKRSDLETSMVDLLQA